MAIRFARRTPNDVKEILLYGPNFGGRTENEPLVITDQPTIQSIWPAFHVAEHTGLPLAMEFDEVAVRFRKPDSVVGSELKSLFWAYSWTLIPPCRRALSAVRRDLTADASSRPGDPPKGVPFG